MWKLSKQNTLIQLSDSKTAFRSETFQNQLVLFTENVWTQNKDAKKKHYY